MFNGIVEELGELVSLNTTTGRELTFQANFSNALTIGESVAVNGVCTTVIHREKNQFRVFASKETLTLTNLSQIKIGDQANLERSLVYGSRISGHLVYGHVDKTLPLLSHKGHGDSWLFTFALEPEDLARVIPKGSIALNGVSLTLYTLESDRLTVMIIPHTYHHTNLSQIKIGDQINCEFDSLGKYVVRYAETQIHH